MADEESERPSLEPPKLFGRKRSGSRTPAPEPAQSPSEDPTDERAADRADDRPAEEPVFRDVGLDRAERPEPTTVLPAVAETDDAQSDGEATSEPRRSRRPRLARRRTTTAAPDDVVEAGPAGSVDTSEPAASEPSEPGPRGPLLPGRPAAVLTGVVVGAALVGLTFLGFRGCEALNGTTSCGQGPGIAALIAIFVLAIVLGRLLLRVFGIPDPGATSFLAVGLTGVIALLFLVDVLDTWPMAIVIPAITAATFLLSWWVTTTFVDDENS